MPDYKNGKIYCIRSYLTDDIYIGSTTSPLSTRMVAHRTKFKNGIYVSSREILKYGDAYIELIEDYPCDSKEQLHRREGQLIRATDKCVNKFIAGRTDTERHRETYEVRKDTINQRRRELYAINKQRILKQLQDTKDQIRCDKNTSQNIISPTDIECQPNSPNSVLNSENFVNSPSNQSAV